MIIHNSNKIFIVIATILTIFVAFFGQSHAANEENDCDMVLSYKDGIYASLDNWEYESILPKLAMTQALINLKNFCCDTIIFEDYAKSPNCTEDSKVDPDGIYPSSAYLYDHILDVSMRRLDAKQSNENGEDLIYGLEPDPTGKVWREFITEHANSKNGSIPLDISTKFKETREASTNTLKSWNPNNQELWSDRELGNYDTWNLVEKYKGVCETSIYLYLKYPGEKNYTKLNSAYQQCEKMSNERIQKEFNYTKAVLMQKGNRLLLNNVKSYLDTYFSQNKLVALQQMIFNIKNTFNEINKAVSESVPNCSG